MNKEILKKVLNNLYEETNSEFNKEVKIFQRKLIMLQSIKRYDEAQTMKDVFKGKINNVRIKLIVLELLLKIIGEVENEKEKTKEE